MYIVFYFNLQVVKSLSIKDFIQFQCHNAATASLQSSPPQKKILLHGIHSAINQFNPKSSKYKNFNTIPRTYIDLFGYYRLLKSS